MSRSIIKKAVGIGSSTLLSRFFAYFREILTMQFLGVGVISDAFFLALRVPTSLRKIFAEGALSSVLVPALIRAERKDGKQGVDKLLSLSFVMIEFLIGVIVIGICWYADVIVYQMAPGASVEQLTASVRFLKILAPFILFLSSSAVLSAALQATNRFLLPGLAPAVLNCLYVGSLALALYFSWSVESLCWSWIGAAALNFLVHVWVSVAYNFKMALPDKNAWSGFWQVMLQLLPCILSVGIGEINFWIDSAFASYLQSGTISLLRCAYQLINIPLGVIATSLSIVLLPQFSKMGHSKQELGAYLSEAIKLVTWMMLPITIVMIFSSREIFETMFFSSKFTMEHVVQAQWNMNAYLVGLIFFALEKILLNAFYALQSTGIATAVAFVTIALNFFMNRMLMSLYGGMGLALATSISASVRIFMFVMILAYYFKIDFHAAQVWRLLRNYLIQLVALGTLFVAFASMICAWISTLSFYYAGNIWFLKMRLDSHFLLHSFGFWIWFGPLAGLFFFAIYRTRKFFGVSFSYLE
jgi:putative peptidoglycan lipid II flippase